MRLQCSDSLPALMPPKIKAIRLQWGHVHLKEKLKPLNNVMHGREINYILPTLQ